MPQRLSRAAKEWLVQLPFIVLVFLLVFWFSDSLFSRLEILANELLLFVSGNYDYSISHRLNLGAVSILTSLALCNFILVGIISDLITVFYKKAEVTDSLQELKETQILKLLLLLPVFALGEELIFRVFFLRALPHIFDWNLYLLIWINSILFALAHISNFKSGGFFRIIPHCYAGLILSYIYLSYGLLTAVLFHYFYNLFLFCLSKITKFAIRDSVKCTSGT